MAECTRIWGPIAGYSMYNFEDENGHIKKIIHGSNKVDMEIANTLKLVNCSRVLNLTLDRQTCEEKISVEGSPIHIQMNENELEAVDEFCTSNNVQIENIEFYARARVYKTKYTSKQYLRQKQRMNYSVYWNENFGYILFFLRYENLVYAVVQELVSTSDETVSNKDIKFPNLFRSLRESFVISIIPLEAISGKFVQVKNEISCVTNRCDKN